MYSKPNNRNGLVKGVPLRVGLSAANPRYAAGFLLLSLTRETEIHKGIHKNR